MRRKLEYLLEVRFKFLKIGFGNVDIEYFALEISVHIWKYCIPTYVSGKCRLKRL